MQRNILSLIALVCMLGTTMYSAEVEPKPAFEPKTPADCQSRVNPNKYIPDTDDHELLCLKRGLKNILWGYETLNFENGLNEKEWNNNTFATLKFYTFGFYGDAVQSHPHGAIIYRKNRERNALLLEKYFLENNISLYSAYIRIVTSTQPQAKKVEEIQELNTKENAYIVGTLLEYSEENIEYFYQYDHFINAHPEELNSVEDTDEKIQAEAKRVKPWAAANTSSWKPEFEKDKNAYKEWMALNKNIPNATLRKQNAALSKAIETLSYNVEKE